jgi:hypothetical protein
MIQLLKNIPKSYFFFAGLIIAFFSLFTIVELNNNKLWTNDFRVYFDATIDYFNGNNPYVKNYGLDTGYFKYPPFTLYIFKFFTLFSYGTSQLIHLFLLMTSLIFSVVTLKELSHKIFGFEFKTNQAWILFVTFLIVAIHLVREFHMGNINLYLLGLLVLGLKYIYKDKPILTALFWSLMLILKPIMLLAVIPLLFYKKWKTIAFMVGFGIFFFLFPVISTGWSGNLVLWGNWVKSVSSHGEYIVSENSLTYLVNYYFGIKSEWIPSLICLTALLSLMIIRIFKGAKNDDQLIIWSVILTAFTPNFFVTDTEHFLLIIPLIAFLLHILSKTKSLIGWILISIGMILFSFNSNDLWGRELSDNFDAHGVLGIGNALFVITFLWLFFRSYSLKKEI